MQCAVSGLDLVDALAGVYIVTRLSADALHR